MRKGLTELVFILDRSGSMRGLERDTISGYNSILDRQKRDTEEDVLVSTVLFDDRQDVIHDRVDIRNIQYITDKDYFVRGCTALLDALGESIHRIAMIHKDAQAEDCPEKTMFVITTDGLENSSRHYSYAKVKSMVERQRKDYGWEFLFLGANIDAIGEASKLGIQADRAANYEHDSEGTRLSYDVLNKAVSSVRKNDQANVNDLSSIIREIENDYRIRHK